MVGVGVVLVGVEVVGVEYGCCLYVLHLKNVQDDKSSVIYD